MLHFLSMTLSNFGPYKGTQTIDFSNRSGVTIFWGDNGRGKTTLLNAFRYALFGTIQRRNGVLRSLRDMENIEGRDEGHYGFSVVLKMDNDGTIYELTRQYRPLKEVTVPNSDDDYEKVMFLKKDGSFLSPNDTEHILNIIMPEQVSRFFLFDGELLQEYEELLENETSTGDRIKEAIEKILGVPVLTNGLVDVRECLENYDKLKSKAAQKDTKTRQFGLQLAAVDDEITEHSKLIESQKAKLSDLYKEKMTLTQKSEETEQVRGWITSRDNARRLLQQRKDSLSQVRQNLCTITKDAWKGMLAERIQLVADELSQQIAALEKRKQNKVVAEKFIIEIKKACQDHKCPVCEQEISDEYIGILEERIRKSESEFSGLSEDDKEKLLSLQGKLSGIRALHTADRQREIKILEDQVGTLQIEIGSLSQEISELTDKITKYGDTSGVAGIAQQLAAVISKIDITEKGIKDEQSVLDKAKESRTNINNLINRQASGGDLLIATQQYALCEQISKIFETGMTKYREKLKKNVEKDATEIFVHLSSDKDYIGLQIHDNYGLSIVHKSGRLVPGRSSGFEHIVALSLIGALHKNAPLRGPIIMDSPFGRLDPTHKQNIVQQLPEMAEQSILLAYTGEIDNQLAREALGNTLIREYHLVRRSSMNTNIE
jgi:DNA sulfur modification protein DndD